MKADADSDPLVYLIAGEASGDVLGAGLMAALRRLRGGRIRFAGVGGEQMAEQGLNSLFPIAEMAVMGVFEILPHVPRMALRLRETVADAASRQPSALVTIDSKAFTLRVHKRLRRRRARQGAGFPLIHMVAPTVWAWRPGRARDIARIVDHLLVLYPFEPPYFERHGLDTHFVGHPAVDQPAGDGPGFRRRHGIPAGAKLLALLPGSRPGEVARLLPPFEAAVERLVRRHDGLRVVVPVAPAVAEAVRARAQGWSWPHHLVSGAAEKFDAFAASDAALAASGTVTLELSLARVPTVVAYRVSPLSAPVGRLLVDRSAVVLTNRVLEQPLLPLYLQGECRPDALAAAVTRLLTDPAARHAQMDAADRLAAVLRAVPAQPASVTAAGTVLRLAGLPLAGGGAAGP